MNPLNKPNLSKIDSSLIIAYSYMKEYEILKAKGLPHDSPELKALRKRLYHLTYEKCHIELLLNRAGKTIEDVNVEWLVESILAKHIDSNPTPWVELFEYYGFFSVILLGGFVLGYRHFHSGDLFAAFGTTILTWLMVRLFDSSNPINYIPYFLWAFCDFGLLIMIQNTLQLPLTWQSHFMFFIVPFISKNLLMFILLLVPKVVGSWKQIVSDAKIRKWKSGQ